MLQQTVGRAGTISLVIIGCVAGAFALYFGRELFVPLAFAVLLTATFRPIVRRMTRWHVPPSIAAAIVVLALTAAVVFGGWALSTPVQHWIAEAPRRFEAAHGKLDRIRRPMQRATAVANQLQRVAEGPSTTPATAAVSSRSPSTGPTTAPLDANSTTPPAASEAPPPALPHRPSWLASALGTTTALLGGAVEVLLLLYLLLAADTLFLEKIVKVIPYWREKVNAVQAVGEVEAMILRYLLVTLCINVGQGILVALVMWMLEMPSPILWGLGTVVLEFVPYLGATVMIAALAMVAITTFDHLGHALAVPLSYLVITTLQNNLVSPIAYGQRLKLNPVAVLVGVMLWWLLWGIAGAFLAVPIVATVKIVSDRIEGLKAVGEFLGD